MVLRLTQDQLGSRIADDAGLLQWYVDVFMPEHLAEFHTAFPRAKLVPAVQRGLRVAERLAFTDRASQVHFITLMWKLGANFFLFPGFLEIAQDTETDGPSRIDRFYTQVTPDQAADAILGSDDRLFFHDDGDDDEASP